MGIKTIKLPRKTVRMASHQFMPPPISEDASMYVGIHADIEIHKAAKLASPHFLRSHETGARSSLYSEPARAASSADASNAGIASMGGLRGCGLRVTGYGLRVAGYGLRVTGCGLRVAGSRNRAPGSGLPLQRSDVPT